MHIDPDALSATGALYARQQAHLDATRRYVATVCDRPGALVGVLTLFREGYVEAVAASTRGLADAAHLARDLEHAVAGFREDVLEADALTAARLACHHHRLEGPGSAVAAVSAVTTGGTGATHGSLGPAAVEPGPAGPSLGPSTGRPGGARPTTALGRLLARRTLEGAGAEAGAGSGGDHDAAPRPTSSARATAGAVWGVHESIDDLEESVRGATAALSGSARSVDDLAGYAAFTAAGPASAGDLAAVLAGGPAR